MKKFSRKSLYYFKDLKKGHSIKFDDLVNLRPGTGISPMKILNFIGKKLKVNVKKNQQLKIYNLK